METGFMNRTIGLVLALVVGGLLVGGLLIPSIEAMTATEKTLDNSKNALFQVDKLDENSDYTFEWSYTDPTKAIVNGEEVGLENATVICSLDSFLLRFGNNSTYGHYLQSVGGALNIIVTENSGTDQGSITISALEGTITAIIVKGETTTTKTITYTEGYGIVSEGPYVMKSPTQKAYMFSDSPIIALGLTTLDGSWANMFQIVGDIEGVEITQIYPNPATYTISDVEIKADASSTYNGVYLLESVTFTATQIADNTKTTECTYNYFIVPAQITAELSQHMTTTEIAMFGVISILGIVALVVVAANGIRNKY